ncbi:SymE family type I addiction module toxin [Prosthecobacter sp.]|uniref:SymE family type I addiction module toxin n=1 Tax=Prosthecobacter sp. TaxID=1965333 RepID=UPI003782E910
MHSRKVYSAWQRRRSVPQIKLQGQWLAAAGLSIGAPIRVQVEHGRLIITPTTATP